MTQSETQVQLHSISAATYLFPFLGAVGDTGHRQGEDVIDVLVEEDEEGDGVTELGQDELQQGDEDGQHQHQQQPVHGHRL